MSAFLNACRYGDVEQVKHFIQNGETNFNDGLNYACIGGNIEIAKLMIEHGVTNINDIFWTVCSYGYLDIVRLLITHGATDFDRGLYGACGGGQLQLFELMIELGATNFDDISYACDGGNIKIVKRMIELGATNFDEGLCSACTGGYFEIAMLMIEMGATNLDINLGGFKNNDEMIIIIQKLHEINGTYEIWYEHRDEILDYMWSLKTNNIPAITKIHKRLSSKTIRHCIYKKAVKCLLPFPDEISRVIVDYLPEQLELITTQINA